MTEAVLELTGVSAGYDETVVIDGLDLRLSRGESLSVIGRNGVGKTTLLATVMGHTRLHGGRISYNGADIGPRTVHWRARAGIGYVPQEREIFPSLTVIENLRVAARSDAWSIDRVFALFPPLAERRRNRGNQLSGGEQQMLAIGRALMGGPSLLLMDEPSEGLAPIIVAELRDAIFRLRDEGGLTMILVEQNTRLALGFAERCLVMNRGRAAYDGPSVRLSEDPDYLDRLIGVTA